MIAAAKEFVDFPIQIRQRARGHRPARIDYDFPRQSQFREPVAYNFANPSPEAVAQDRFTHGFGRSESNAGRRAGSLQTECRKQRTGVTDAVIINFAEFAGS